MRGRRGVWGRAVGRRGRAAAASAALLVLLAAAAVLVAARADPSAAELARDRRRQAKGGQVEHTPQWDHSGSVTKSVARQRARGGRYNVTPSKTRGLGLSRAAMGALKATTAARGPPRAARGVSEARPEGDDHATTEVQSASPPSDGGVETHRGLLGAVMAGLRALYSTNSKRDGEGEGDIDDDPEIGPGAMAAMLANAVPNGFNVSARDPRSYRLLELAECDARRVLPARDAKVGFLFFLTHATMPELMWRAFFEDVPPEQYRIYTHVNPDCPRFSKPKPHNCTFGPDSFFHNTAAIDVQTGEVLRIRTGRFSFSLIQVERHMLAHALKDDPLIDRFLLLSETSVPMWPFSAIRRAVMLQPAMINTARNFLPEAHALSAHNKALFEGAHARRRFMQYEATERQRIAALYLVGTTPAYKAVVKPGEWGKSSQWWVLTRKEACAVTTDWEVTAAHDKSCYVGGCWAEPGEVRHKRNSWYEVHAPDEHYFPTTIAHYGLGKSPICFGSHKVAWPDDSLGHTKLFAGDRNRLRPHELATFREEIWNDGHEDVFVDLAAVNPQEYLDEFLPEDALDQEGCNLHRVPSMCRLFVRKVPFWEADLQYMDDNMRGVWTTDRTGFPEPSGPSWPCANFSTRYRDVHL